MAEFYYSENGQRMGPLAEDVMRRLVARRKLSGTTLCWTEGFGQNWKRLSETDLWPRVEPPPLPADEVNNSFAYLMASIPFIGRLSVEIISQIYPEQPKFAPFLIWLSYVVAYSLVAALDVHTISGSGNPKARNIGALWIFPPIYLWFRARRLQQKPFYFWLWFAALAFAIFV